MAGPIGFIGIVIPHFAKFIVGHDHRWVLPYCAVLGAILLVTADIGARYLIMPEEVPVGVMTAIIGTPIFVYIARRGSKMKNYRTLRIGKGGISLLIGRKALFSFVILLVLTACAVILSAGIGERFISPGAVAKTFWAWGSGR